jgi:hypothetical protein
MGSDNEAQVGGLAAALSNGTYSYVVRSLSGSAGKQTRGSFEKQGGSVAISIPSEGLFQVTIYDRLNTPRIDLLLSAARGTRGAQMVKTFQEVEALLKDWNEDYQGWPVHELRRAYLLSNMLGIKPSSHLHQSLPLAEERTHKGDVACEPAFSPNPGVFKTDVEVTLHCDTPGATIRYSVDGSQPLDGAAVYRAPIVVKVTALTIKAFASAAGKKDSPVVTGIFRIGD